ncbi:hypothetical protein CDEST_00700 [Colletotrichum destructivum]|uniref:C2H2-type domain-containing protein n=1 Tax=Colletotrichum destructivum TaxID=34406 RepID=A0AAX4HXV6_9PEZI|nr:hypothetical protein CDEST_00700 [Colletotrichum destructivum]
MNLLCVSIILKTRHCLIFSCVSTRMSSNNSSGARFLCMVQDCTANPFSTMGNLLRHIKSQHSPLASWVKMPCDKVLKSNLYNNRRHSTGCSNALCRGYEGLGETFFAPHDYKKDRVQSIIDARDFMSPQDAVLKWFFVNLDTGFVDN